MESERRFEVATDGSDTAELLCEVYLKPFSDELCGEPFVASAAHTVNLERLINYEDDTSISVTFDARKSGWKGDEGVWSVTYNVRIVYGRSRSLDEFWPPVVEIVTDDEDDDQDSGSVLTFGEFQDGPDDDTEREELEDDDDLSTAELHFVREVWDFIIDDEQHRTRKDVRYEYYDELANLLGIVSLNQPTVGDQMLSEVPDEDIHLQVYDGSFSRSYSENDIRVIEAVCRQDLAAIKKLLAGDGCYLGQGFEFEE